MNIASHDLIAASSTLNAGAAFIGGLVIAGALVWAVRMGIRVRRLESRPPTPEEQPRLPEGGAVHEEREMREPDEVPHAANESERLMPYNMHSAGTKHADDQHRKRWQPGSSGSFGSGGPGRT
ncbi:DUF6479 family protein [Streptomyces sp. NBC_00638]|uniref:DUF6479 family protein n=1 Tax=unclassified Streptomyces TaxID=2593676 RepID=UPI0022540AD3|nr:DUF6479 family protein [Streptomyces sp. NBC_00638]MCX5001567.1 DUF6479 family protein [Streptomyces sp. NBC_00638]